MNTGWKPLALSAAALVLLMCIPTSLNVMTLFVTMAPFTALFALLQPVAFASHLVPVGVAAYFLLGGYGPIALTMGFFFLIPAVVMGWMYKRGKNPRTTILTGFLVLLIQLLLELALFSAVWDLDLAGELAAMAEAGLLQLQAGSGAALPDDWAASTARAFGHTVVSMLPALLLIGAFVLAIVNHALSRRMLMWAGVRTDGLPPMKTWRLPRSLVFYYLVALIASMAVRAEDTGVWSVIVNNMMPVLKLAFTIQAIAFFFFLADLKKWPRAVPVLIAVPLLLFPPLYLIGLLDVAFPLRKYFDRQQG